MIGDLVMSGKRLPLNDLPKDVPSEIRDLITVCWNKNPEKRPSFSGNKIKSTSSLMKYVLKWFF